MLIGNGGAEFGVRGYITAYDAGTGKQAWRFYTVPGNPAQPFENKALEKAAGTWAGDWWKYGGGGLAPDLAYASIPTTAEGFKQIVHRGGYLSLGMPRFGDRLSESDAEDIRKYILTKAREQEQTPPVDTKYKKAGKR